MADVSIEQRASAFYVRIQRPERENRLSLAVLDAITDALGRAEESEGARVVVLTGTGGDYFCAGGQVAGLAENDADQQLKFAESYLRLHTQLRRLSLPLLCAVNGQCHAAGMSLLLAADMAIAVEDSTFGYPEIGVGLFPILALASAVRFLPRKLAFEMCYTGRLLNASEALELNLVNAVVPPAALEMAIERLANELASRSTRSMGLGRRAFHVMEQLNLDEAHEYAKASLVALLAGDIQRQSSWS